MPKRVKTTTACTSPAERLESLLEEVLQLARTAARNRANLRGDNFYANKLARLRAEAVNAFREFSGGSVGDTVALAELIGAAFSPDTARKERTEATREAAFTIRTTWQEPLSPAGAVDELIPSAILGQTKRRYITTIGDQMNGCFSTGYYDASAVMMRRLLEIAIIEVFEAKTIAHRIKGSDGNYVQLTELVNRLLSQATISLSRNVKRALPDLRDLGHLSAHGRYYLARKSDIERFRMDYRVVIEELLHHAGLQ